MTSWLLLPLLRCGASRDLKIPVLCDAGTVPAEYIHALARRRRLIPGACPQSTWEL